MKSLVLSGRRILMGSGSLSYLAKLPVKNAVLITGGSSMLRTGVIGRAAGFLEQKGIQVHLISGIRKNPSFEEVFAGVSKLREYQPDAVIAIGGGSAMDAAKGMLLFYEFPFLTRDNVLDLNAAGKIPAERKTMLVCVPSTSGTGSELTRGTVLTDTKQRMKVPIMTDCLRPDIAILDQDLAMTMPAKVAAETGMDALTHAVESITNFSMDEIDLGLAREAVRLIMNYLPASVKFGDKTARAKVHYAQAMAGISFANVGLGMVHGIAHSFGAAFDLAHGLTNAVILPYVLTYNAREPYVRDRLLELSDLCHVQDFTKAVEQLRAAVGIPASFADAGILESQYLENKELLLEHAMLGATRVNPVPMTRDSMAKMLDAVYYGREIDF